MYNLHKHFGPTQRYFPQDTAYADFYGERLHKLLKLIKNYFRQNRHFVLWAPSEGPLFLELQCSFVPGTDL
jgi:hypothetical protein